MTYYDILEINEKASPEVIKASYRALAKKYHPDSYKGNATERDKTMALINEAYNVLIDEEQRSRYDLKLNTQNSSSGETASCNYEDVDISPNDYDSANSDGEEKPSGWFGKLFTDIGKEIINSLQRNSSEMENAYLQGLSLDEYTLVRRFKNSNGYIRVGYAKALEEKGLLERDSNGRLVPSYRFKQLF